MCFSYESDWHASTVVETEREVTELTHGSCHECHQKLIGKYHNIYMQEHEECHRCAEGECECLTKEDEYHDCQCADPEYGESFDYDCCDNCWKILQGIEAAEIEEGCESYEARPALGMMIEELQNRLEWDGNIDHYLIKAEQLFPEIKDHIAFIKSKLTYHDEVKS